jgi:hypothetical protein
VYGPQNQLIKSHLDCTIFGIIQIRTIHDRDYGLLEPPLNARREVALNYDMGVYFGIGAKAGLRIPLYSFYH